jgi:hypothetical protein
MSSNATLLPPPPPPPLPPPPLPPPFLPSSLERCLALRLSYLRLCRSFTTDLEYPHAFDSPEYAPSDGSLARTLPLPSKTYATGTASPPSPSVEAAGRTTGRGRDAGRMIDVANAAAAADDDHDDDDPDDGGPNRDIADDGAERMREMTTTTVEFLLLPACPIARAAVLRPPDLVPCPVIVIVVGRISGYFAASNYIL